MRRFFLGAFALWPVAAMADEPSQTGHAANEAYIFQNGGNAAASRTKVTRGDGFVIIEQDSNMNHAVIIQSR